MRQKKNLAIAFSCVINVSAKPGPPDHANPLARRAGMFLQATSARLGHKGQQHPSFPPSLSATRQFFPSIRKGAEAVFPGEIPVRVRKRHYRTRAEAFSMPRPSHTHGIGLPEILIRDLFLPVLAATSRTDPPRPSSPRGRQVAGPIPTARGSGKKQFANRGHRIIFECLAMLRRQIFIAAPDTETVQKKNITTGPHGGAGHGEYRCHGKNNC